jgi:iron complex outermembrane receptor protein
VTDSSNNPIIGVSIYVPELHKGTADLRDAILDKSVGNLKLLFEYVGYSNQVKTIKIKPNQNDLNVTLEPTVLKWMR